MSVQVDSDFDSGNIEVLSIDDHEINLKICDDPYPKYTKQKYNYWFYFNSMHFNL